MSEKKLTANDVQVGGMHYKGKGEFQHWDVAIAMNWDYLVGSATKYLWRLGLKGNKREQIQDVKKAIHYLQKKVEVMQKELAEGEPEGAPTRNYVDQG